MPKAAQRQGGSSLQGWLCPWASGGPPGSPALWVMLSRALTFSGPDLTSTLPRAVWVRGGAGCGCSSRLNWPSVPKGASGLALGVARARGQAAPWAPAAASWRWGRAASRERGMASASVPACHPGTLPPRNLVGCNCWCLFRSFLCKVTSCLPSEQLTTQRGPFESRRRAHQGGRLPGSLAVGTRAAHLHVIPGPRLLSRVKCAISCPTGGLGSWRRDCSGPSGGRRLWPASLGPGLLSLQPAAGLVCLACPSGKASGLGAESGGERGTTELPDWPRAPQHLWTTRASLPPPLPSSPSRRLCRVGGQPRSAVMESHSWSSAPTDAPPSPQSRWPSGPGHSQPQPCSANSHGG